jgi:hypothetical protein
VRQLQQQDMAAKIQSSLVCVHEGVQMLDSFLFISEV